MASNIFESSINLKEETKKHLKLIEQRRIFNVKGYQYIILPLDYECSFFEMRLYSTLLRKLIEYYVKIEEIDKIVTLESKGILISTLPAYELRIPLNIVRKRKLMLPNEVSVIKKTGYAESVIYINGIDKGDKIVIIDDLISTGGTLKATLDALINMNVEILGIFILFDKVQLKGSQIIRKNYAEKYKFPFKSIFELKIHQYENNINSNTNKEKNQKEYEIEINLGIDESIL
ncbi:MAG: phosphoribosyltransferase family protein [Promethearchaeota archaeon]